MTSDVVVLAYLAAVNVAAFLAFGLDKRAAAAKARRIPERTLLGLAAIGGSPGAVAAQQLFRHKTRKQPFAALLHLIVFIQVVAVVILLAVR